MNALEFLTGPDIAALATEADAVGFLEEALISGRVDPEDDSPRLFSPASGGEFLMMPTSAPTWSGVKLVPVVAFGTGPRTERHLRCLAAVVGRIEAVVEGRASAMRESGNLLSARRVEEWADLPVANLADLVAGRFERRPGRPAVFSGVGMAWEDLVVATALYERHRQRSDADAAIATPARTQRVTGVR